MSTCDQASIEREAVSVTSTKNSPFCKCLLLDNDPFVVHLGQIEPWMLRGRIGRYVGGEGTPLLVTGL